MVDIDVLAAELAQDPLGRGYAGMTDEAAAAELNAVWDAPATRTRERETITNTELYEATAAAEYAALSAGDKADYQELLSLDVIRVTSGSRGRAKILAMFNAQSATRANLLAIAILPMSRAKELGLRRVRVGDVQRARAK